MVFSSENFPLPRFPASLIPTFRMLCEALSDEDAQALQPKLLEFLETLEEKAKTESIMNITLARSIGKAAQQLLQHYSEFSQEGKAFAIGALRYFAFAEDSLSESIFATGFDDDAKVINHVLEKVGLERFAVKIQ